MAPQACTCSTDANTEFLGTEPIRLILTFDGEYIFRKFRFRREKIVTIAEYTEWAIAVSSRIGYP